MYKRDAPFGVVFKVKTLAVFFSAYPREMKHIPRNLNLPPFCRYLFYGNGAIHSHARARLKHAHSFDPCGLLARSNTGSPRFTDFPSLCACSESSLTNLISCSLNLLCLQSHSKTECRWTWPEVAILGADQKERGLWGRECSQLCWGENGGVLSMRMQVILDSSFARPGSAPIWGGKKGEFRDWTRFCSTMRLRAFLLFPRWDASSPGVSSSRCSLPPPPPTCAHILLI